MHSDWPKMPCSSHYCLVVLSCCTALYAVVGASTRGYPECVVCYCALSVEALLEVKQAEKDSEIFTEMPSEHYMEVASLLLNQ